MGNNLPAIPEPIEGELIEPVNSALSTFPRRRTIHVTAKLAIPKLRWTAPRDPRQQAWRLREYLKDGRNALVLSCERTRQIDPENPSSPVVVCNPDNCDEPCFNCTIAILTGRKTWIFED